MSIPQWPRQVTVVLLAAVAAILIIWDFVAYYLASTQATLSDVVGNWMTQFLWITLAWALLTGHLLGSGKTPITAAHVAVVIAGIVLGYVATVLS